MSRLEKCLLVQLYSFFLLLFGPDARREDNQIEMFLKWKFIGFLLTMETDEKEK